MKSLSAPPPTAPRARRRQLLLGGAAALGLGQVPALAQQLDRVYRVGVLLPTGGLAAQPYVAALRQQLGAHGFVEGRNLRLEIRYGFEAAEARDLAATRFDALLACTTILASAMHAAAGSTPLVFAWVADPVGAGLVRSYARPAGSATGIANRFYEMARKRVEVLRELLPGAVRVAAVAGIFDTTARAVLRHSEREAGRLGMVLIPTAGLGGWAVALERALAAGAQAILLITPFAVFGMRLAAEEMVAFSIERRMPAMFADAESVELGGLMFYGTDLLSDLRQAADLLARVLMGEKPGDIPVEQATRFELVVNLKTARAIGLEVPKSILLRADRVIE
jgi:putative ABC transport system substrate-binding protein